MGALGAMQDFPLRITRLMDHAEREHGTREIVAARPTAPLIRTNWIEVTDKSRRLAQALERLGVDPGERVATLAMNHDRHLIAWFGVVGMGGVLHTLNPRLFDDQLTYIINHAEDRVILYDRAFAPLVERLKPRADGHSSFGLLRRRVRRAARRRERRLSPGTKATSGSRAASATPAARRATRRACCTSIARPCFTP